ncbi:MAG: arylsulfatase [Deltaproteobacteria bacterium]|nr:arylsulfatase [Deltaproteobacteria bacterium]
MSQKPLRIGRTIAESTPAFDPLPRPPEGAPNVVVIVLDDLGFAQLGCFGGDVDTPAIDRLAAGGLRYRSFHVTALCSPTRAALLTGRNHHAVGMGFLTDLPTGFPGYNGRIPKSAATLPRLLRDTGYSTFAVGKWHLLPRWEQSAAGPFDRWPLGLGFERYYGFLAGDTNQWAPELVSDNGFVDPPASPEEGYHLTEDLADRAIRFVLDQQQATPGKPFFLYFATGAMHAPHQAPLAWIDRHRGRYDGGWEAFRDRAFARQQELGIVRAGAPLPGRPPWIAPWKDLSAEEQTLFARMMEVYAGFLAHTDAQIGRVVDFLEQRGLLDDTMVVLISDNGASAEGGPLGSDNEHRFAHDMLDDPSRLHARVHQLGGHRTYGHYAWGWAWAGNTPFRLWKRFAWLGGVRTPLVVHWPRGIAARGAVRGQFCHAIDVLPTVLDVVGLEAPAVVDGIVQQPIDGASLRATFDDEAAPDPRKTQYFEMLGSRSIWHDGWKATADHVGNQLTVERERVSGSHDFETDRWSLFKLDDDPAEANDLSEEQPVQLRRLVDLWWAEAGRNHVLPLEDGFLGRAVAMEPSPWGVRGRADLTAGGGPVSETLLPPMGGGFRLVAEIEVPEEGADGVVAALGDWHNGWACYVVDGAAAVCLNLFGDPVRVVAPEPLAPGPQRIEILYRRARAGGGPLALCVGGAPVAHGRVPSDLPFRWQIGGAGLLIGEDRGFPVCEDYRPPATFRGRIERVVLEALALLPPDQQAEIEALLRHE